MDAELTEILNQLKIAVETVLNPVTSHEQRLEAHQACENFKENSPRCAECGLVMAQKEQPPIIRHFGMQLLEHCVKHRWTRMSPEEKVFIKSNTMDLIATGTHNLLTEQMHIKDVLSRIVVEIVKREWPTCWPSFLEDLYQLCHMGETQTELVMLIIQRLAEDAAVFQTIPYNRRQEIMAHINNHMPELFLFMLDKLQAALDGYVTQPTESEQRRISCKVAQAVMATISTFLDWMNIEYYFEKNGLLLQMLCASLQFDDLRLPAVECLLQITTRKGKLESRKQIYLLFGAVPMGYILDAAVKASNMECEEMSYLFLKKLCQVLTSLGQAVLALWGVVDGCGEPENFKLYLQAILAFTQHPSKALCSYTQSLWAAFLRHEQISQNSHLVSMLPALLESSKVALLKVGCPSQNNSKSCAFSRLDYDSDAEFSMMFSKYRAEVSETIRQATLLHPVMMFNYASTCLRELLQKPIDIGDGTDSGHCNLSSPGFLEWDAMTILLDSVTAKLLSSPKPKPDPSEGLALLKMVLEYETQDPIILSCVLSYVSSLFPMTTNVPEILPTVLNKIFAAATFSLEGQTKATRSKAVMNVRRHACSVLVKICKQHPTLLLPGFDQLYHHIQQLSSDPDQLSQLEKCTLMEALVLLSNEYKDFQKQSSFVKEILEPVKELWLGKELKSALWSTDKFLTYVGLDQAAVEPSSEDTCGINRSLMTYCIITIQAVLKRAKWPNDLDAAKNGGFVVRTQEDGTFVLRNPGSPHICALLENVLALTRTINDLWHPDNLKKRHPDFEKAYDLFEGEKLVILGMQLPWSDNTESLSHKQPLERMHSFLRNLHESCYHVIANACQFMVHDFYMAPHLADSLLSTLFHNLDLLPVHRLRNVIRVVMKPYIQYCPKECYQSALIPVLGQLCPFMMQLLASKWKVIDQRSLDGEEEDNEESQEVLEDQLTRLMTREYADLLGCVFQAKYVSASPDDNMMIDEEGASSGGREEGLSELGLLVLQSDVFPSLVLFCFSALSWTDTVTCHRCAKLAIPILKQLVATKKLNSDDACHLLSMILVGLQTNGQHEALQHHLVSQCLQAYECLRPEFPAIQEVMGQISSCTPEALKVFDEKLLTSQPQNKPSEKKRGKEFKKLISDVIGRHVGQKFKENLTMPPLVSKSQWKKKQLSAQLNTEEAEEVGLCVLFTHGDL